MPVPVVVVGSGAAGLAAALGASHAGADVVVLERDDRLGGTTAISGGIAWIPANRWELGAGIEDNAEAALSYLRALASGDFDDDLMSAFVTEGPRIMEELEQRSALRFEALLDWPDYHSELVGGRDGGRSVWPKPLTVPSEVAGRVRVPLEHTDDHPTRAADDGVVLRGPVRGHALVAGLVMALLDQGVELRTGVRAGPLLLRGDRVAGIDADGETLAARVVLATGGFQHDRRLAAAFLPAAGVVPLGTPGSRGDGLRMALAAGADLGNMAEGWWMPAAHIPGEKIDGVPFWRSLHSERAQPGSIMVDRTGRRFVDEAQNYGDVGRAMQRFDAARHTWTAAPAWLVFDARYRSCYPVGPLDPLDPDPQWLRRGDDIGTLAAAAGLPAQALAVTVARFNAGAARGQDPDFGRGSRRYDRWVGGATLAPVDAPPFYALAVYPGCLGTKGGPRTDGFGRVLTAGRRPIPGLYAAGNVAASPFGTATAAGGATIGPALVFGTRAGTAAAHDRQEGCYGH